MCVCDALPRSQNDKRARSRKLLSLTERRKPAAALCQIYVPSLHFWLLWELGRLQRAHGARLLVTFATAKPFWSRSGARCSLSPSKDPLFLTCSHWRHKSAFVVSEPILPALCSKWCYDDAWAAKRAHYILLLHALAAVTWEHQECNNNEGFNRCTCRWISTRNEVPLFNNVMC